MKLVNMKIDPEAVKEKYAEPAINSTAGPIYPWGLSLRLDEEAIAKLGLKDLPDAGGVLMVSAKVMVTEVTQREEVYDGKPKLCRSLCLQITDLGLGTVKEESNAEKTLYKG